MEQRSDKIKHTKHKKNWTKQNLRTSAPVESVLQPEEPKEEPKFAKRALISNREKFDTDIKDESNEQMLAADFAQLLDAPQSVGGHFQFSNEKNWGSEFKHVSDNSNKIFHNYFSLNLSLLCESLSTIPFYERMDIDQNIFTQDEIIDMKRKAKVNEENYRICTKNGKRAVNKEMDNAARILNILTSKDEVEEKDKITFEKNIKVNEKNKSKVFTLTDVHDDDLDELLQMQNGPTKVNSKSLKKINDTTSLFEDDVIPISEKSMSEKNCNVADTVLESKDDIQQWLDNVLND